jgi:hypothetical protein
MIKTDILDDILQLIGDTAVMVERANKAGDPGQARRWAVAKTELEKASAWIYTYCESVGSDE